MINPAMIPGHGEPSPRVRADGSFLPAMTSYAQNFEDVMLRRGLQDIDAGFYVDIGAYDPSFHSVTRSFYDAGWSGINVEPHPDLFRRLTAARPRDINLNCAAGGGRGRAPFSLVGQTGLSSLLPLDPVLGEWPIHRVEVEVMTVDEIVATHAGHRTIDFLKIDVEGAEAAVLEAAGLHRHRPRIVIVEATRPMSQEPAWQDWEPLVLDAAYHFAWYDGLNRFYVRDEDRARLVWFRLPPCCFDNFRIAHAEPIGGAPTMQACPEDPAAVDAPRPAAQAGLEVRVPVSLGELLDKISILEIKSERIRQAERLANVRYELALLRAELARVLSPLPDEIAALAASLKGVNERIWDAEDIIHGPDADTLPDDAFLRQARIAFDQNDVRARLKRRINDLSGSTVVEEKSYPDFGGTTP